MPPLVKGAARSAGGFLSRNDHAQEFSHSIMNWPGFLTTPAGAGFQPPSGGAAV
jgi:hypothetical protein